MQPDQNDDRPPKRKKLTADEKLAAALLMMTDGNGKPVIDREWAKTVDAKTICRQFEMDHGVHVAVGGDNHPTNVTPRIKAEHREKTATVDVPQIAKTKRVAKDFEAFRSRLLAKTAPDDRPEPARQKAKIAGRPMQGTKASGLKKKMNGKVVRRP